MRGRGGRTPVPRARVSLRASCMLAAVAATGTAACDSDPLLWEPLADTVSLTSVMDPTLNAPSVLDLIGGFTYRIESANVTGVWDVALVGLGDSLGLATPGWLGIESDARMVRMSNVSFDDVRMAPADSAEYTDHSAHLVPGDVYVVRTRESVDPSGVTCSYYGKLYALSTDPERNRATLVHTLNPYCGSRLLEPGG